MNKQPKIFLYQYGEAEKIKHYVIALQETGSIPVVSTDIDDCIGCDGLLLPGGCDADPSLYGQENIACRKIDKDRDTKELALAYHFLAQKRPILGVCRGHQLLNCVFGGSLIQDIATPDTHQEKNNFERVHDTKISEGSLLSPYYGSRAMVCTAHHQAIERLGTGLRIVQWADDGIIEAVVHEELPVFGVQWHPEQQAFERRRTDTVDGAQVFEILRKFCETY